MRKYLFAIRSGASVLDVSGAAVVDTQGVRTITFEDPGLELNFDTALPGTPEGWIFIGLIDSAEELSQKNIEVAASYKE